MKINVTVDLEDLWINEDNQNVNEVVLDEIKNGVVNKCVCKFFDIYNRQIDKEFAKHIEESVEKETVKFFEKEITMETLVNKNRYGGGKEMVPLREIISELFQKNVSSGIENRLKNTAKKFADELRKRYDMQFASHVVNKMKENGFLNENAIKALTE